MTSTITHAPIEPIASLDQWADALAAIARQPLELCPRFPDIARRFDAWWQCAATDRPIFIGQAARPGGEPITRRIDLLSDPDAWFDAKRRDLKRTHCVGDALPAIRIDFGPVLIGSLLGGRTEIGSDTTWTHPFIHDDWSNEPSWELQTDHPWWSLLGELLQRVADDARGRYLVKTPDLGGSGDVLLNLRGCTELCMDVIERPERITAALDRMYPAWHRTFSELYRRTVERGAGVVHWLGIWSSQPYMIPACDFNFVLGPDDFNRLLLPDIARQAATVGQAVFHLDGPGAAKHIDALLDVPDIRAIQFTPGDGEPSTRPWHDMFRKIQERGRALYVFTPADEVVELSQALKPEGLAIAVNTAVSPDELDRLFEQFRKPFGG